MNNIRLYMAHDLTNIPVQPLPENYQFSRLQKEADKKHWAEIVAAADEFATKQAALERFDHEFKPHLSETKQRMIFLQTHDGHDAGTATAWFDTWNRQTIGRLHWVAIHPEYQGKKLGKPLIAEAMNVLASFHQQAYLRTQPRNLTAIRIYRQFGFEPIIRSQRDEQAWNAVYSQLQNR
ncbi:GNAT family N-acetyltransferase [Lentibacillus cibarius]|nr:GNAT family N-acetyltransferase [Lentibacillus cibarius]